MDGPEHHDRPDDTHVVLLAQIDIRVRIMEEWQRGLEERLERKYVSANEWKQWRWMLSLMVGSGALAILAAIWRLILLPGVGK